MPETINDQTCYTYQEVHELTGYSAAYIEKLANGHFEDPVDLSDHKIKLGPTSAFLTEQGVRTLGVNEQSDIDATIEERLNSE